MEISNSTALLFFIGITSFFYFVPIIKCTLELGKTSVFSTRVFALGGFGYTSGNFLRITMYDDFFIAGIFFDPVQIFYKDIEKIYIKERRFISICNIVIETEQGKKFYISSRRKKLEKILSIINEQRNKLGSNASKV